MIQVQNVTKTHRQGEEQVEVLRGLSCTIPKGTFTFIVGPSGSGKSTLLYLIGALDQPTSGEILIDGKPLSSLQDDERDEFRRNQVGFIFQSFNLLSNLDAVANVLVPYLPNGEAVRKRPEAIELLKQVGLGHRLNHRPSQLSGGEQQRVAIARALLKKPRLLLADEPTGELDSHNGAQIFEYLRSLQASHGVTVITVTHDQRYLKPDDHILEIRDGRIVES